MGVDRHFAGVDADVVAQRRIGDIHDRNAGGRIRIVGDQLVRAAIGDPGEVLLHRRYGDDVVARAGRQAEAFDIADDGAVDQGDACRRSGLDGVVRDVLLDGRIVAEVDDAVEAVAAVDDILAAAAVQRVVAAKTHQGVVGGGAGKPIGQYCAGKKGHDLSPVCAVGDGALCPETARRRYSVLLLREFVSRHVECQASTVAALAGMAVDMRCRQRAWSSGRPSSS